MFFLFTNFANMNRIFILLTSIFIALSLQAQNEYIQCEDTCTHIHGIDLSHYQGSVFWETVGDNSKMAYVYLKATEGGDNIDSRYEENIYLAHKYGLKVGSYHFFRPKADLNKQLQNFMTQCRPGYQSCRKGLQTKAFTLHIHKFLQPLSIREDRSISNYDCTIFGTRADTERRAGYNHVAIYR